MQYSVYFQPDMFSHPSDKIHPHHAQHYLTPPLLPFPPLYTILLPFTLKTVLPNPSFLFLLLSFLFLFHPFLSFFASLFFFSFSPPFFCLLFLSFPYLTFPPTPLNKHLSLNIPGYRKLDYSPTFLAKRDRYNAMRVAWYGCEEDDL